MPWEPNLPNPTAPPLPCGRQPSLYYYPSLLRAPHRFYVGQAGSLRPIVNRPASEARLRARRSAPGSPEYPARFGCGSAALWGRLAACGGLSTRPASGARLRARRSGPRQSGISRAVGLRLCCYVGQAGSLRRVVNPPGERSSPPRETNWPPAVRNITRGSVAAVLLCGQVVNRPGELVSPVRSASRPKF